MAGTIFYKSSDLAAEIKQYNAEYSKAKREDLPSSLHLYQAVLNGPVGKSLSIFFMWASSDLEEGQRWLLRVSSWLPVGMSTVQPTTHRDFGAFTNTVIPKHTYGTIFTVNFYDLTPEVLDVIGTHAQRQPNNPEVIFGVHELRHDAPREPTFGTVFDNRCAHYLIEMIPMGSSPEVYAEGLAWAQEFVNALRKTDAANIVPSTYISLTPPKGADMGKIYGSRYETLQRIKEQYDPQNVFKNALPQF